MISTGELMLGKALLTATAVLGFCIWQLHNLRRLKREREQAEQEAELEKGDQPDSREPDHASSGE